MTRERQQHGSAAVLPPLATRGAAPRAAGDSATVEAPPHRLIWEQWFRAASPAQQAEMLKLAQQQGFVFAHQTPPLNGARASAEPMHANALTHLLAGKPLTHAGVPAAAAPPVADSDLDAAQREAVARALASPDVFLLRGWPGTGKSRVLVEIILQACRRGERVLLTAARSGSIDRLLPLAFHGEAAPLRFLGPAEKVEHLAQTIQPLVHPTRCQAFAADAVTQARLAVSRAEHGLAQRLQEEKSWNELTAAQQHLDDLHQKLAAYQERAVRVAEQLDQDLASIRQEGSAATAWGLEILAADQEWQHHQQVRAERVGALAQQKTAIEQQRSVLDGELQTLTPLAEAKRRGRWWTWTWWKATFRGQVVAQADQLREKIHGLEQDAATVNAQIQEAEQQAEVQKQSWRDRVGQVCAAEQGQEVD